MIKAQSVFPPSTLQDAIRAAIAFFDQFDYPLTVSEIERYMLGVRGSSNEVKLLLQSDDAISERHGFYFLSGREGILNVRRVREKIADEYRKKVSRLVPLARVVPFIRSIAVCNTLAFNCPTSQSDIDLFVLTKKGRIFTARTGLTLLFALLGVRRHAKKVAGRFCLSFFLSDGAPNLVDMKRGENDVYLLYWFRTLKPVFGADAFKGFLEANEWLGRYFWDYESYDDTFFQKRGAVVRFVGHLKELVLGTFIGTWLETFLRNSHLKRHSSLRKRLGPESDVVVSDFMLKYHNIDRRDELNKAFFERYGRLQ